MRKRGESRGAPVGEGAGASRSGVAGPRAAGSGGQVMVRRDRVPEGVRESGSRKEGGRGGGRGGRRGRRPGGRALGPGGREGARRRRGRSPGKGGARAGGSGVVGGRLGGCSGRGAGECALLSSSRKRPQGVCPRRAPEVGWSLQPVGPPGGSGKPRPRPALHPTSTGIHQEPRPSRVGGTGSAALGAGPLAAVGRPQDTELTRVPAPQEQALQS